MLKFVNLKVLNTICSILFVFSFLGVVSAQQPVMIHSHNDYKQRVPFYQAYAQQVSSIEADVFSVKGHSQLMVAHEFSEIEATQLTLNEAYIQPLVNVYKHNQGRAWKDSKQILYLLVDIKTASDITLKQLIEELKPYPEVFDPAVNPQAVRVVISGNSPSPNHFENYPSFISFDGRPSVKYTTDQLKRVAMMSDNFRKYTVWNGKGLIVAAERIKIDSVINYVHQLNKPIRFWGTPDYYTAWNTFFRMGIDFINTDKPELCSDFFRNFSQKNFVIGNHPSISTSNKTTTDRLDKITSNFKGFDNKEQTLSKSISLYKPTYKNDGANKRVKNIIFLIGDGMGLAQVSAAATANKGLVMLLMKYLGLQKTSALDAHTTDSAGAGSALATGKKTNNRYISMGDSGVIHPTLCEILAPKGISCGVVTLGNIADATPAVYYGHTTERNNSDEITQWLLKGNLTLLCGSGRKVLTQRADKRNLEQELASQYRIAHSIDDLDHAKGKVICLDERMNEATTENTLPLLAQATTKAINQLDGINDQGFFLMVEGAKIDYAGHANSLPSSIIETLGFDLAVAEAMKFADSNGETLVVVTGDHETGGLTLVDGDNLTGQITARYMTDDHTPIMLPVYAYGPQASNFAGVYENTHLFELMLKLIQGE